MYSLKLYIPFNQIIANGFHIKIYFHTIKSIKNLFKLTTEKQTKKKIVEDQRRKKNENDQLFELKLNHVFFELFHYSGCTFPMHT